MPTKHVLSLRPSQFVLGMTEVENKVKKIKKMSPKQLQKYIDEHIVPVTAIAGELYINDHHHFVRACWESGISKVKIKVVLNIKKPNPVWMYLRDQFGNLQHHSHLPVDVRGMADDPYRSLAWVVREEGGYNKVPINFSEFYWANYFRENIDIDTVRYHFDDAVKKALKLCKKENGASQLPGYKYGFPAYKK